MIEALGISMVKNEADIIEAFARHNLAFMDILVLIDNDSADDTREIIVQLQGEGLPIVLLDDPVVSYFQAEKLTAAYRQLVAHFKPRFAFLLDADEFIVTPSRDALYDQLRTLSPGTQAQYYWRTYIPAPTGPEGDERDPLRSITHRKAAEERWPKSIVVTDPNIDTKLRIDQGSHDVKLDNKSLPQVELHDIALAHFPVRSVDQITGKVLVGWLAYADRNRHRRRLRRKVLAAERKEGFQWKILYDRITHGQGIATEDLTHEAFKYGQSSPADFKWPDDVVHDPVEPAYASLTTQSKTLCTPLQKVLRCMDKALNPDNEMSALQTLTAFLQDPHTKIAEDIIARQLSSAPTDFSSTVQK